MSYPLGIDLGTTNSVVSVVRRGVVETLPVDGMTTLPSVVSVRADGSVLVGRAAKARLQLDSESTVASAKRDMGDPGKVYHVAGRTMSPVDVASHVLRRLVEAATRELGDEPKEAVITVPAYFNDAQRADTRRAGEAAGLKVLRLLPEPTAAAIAYGADKRKDQRIMVFDLGGGTFDISILEIRGNEFQVKAVGGDGKLGGDDMDATIIQWAEEQFTRGTGINLRELGAREAAVSRQKLREAAEAAKIVLSESSAVALRIPDFARGEALELELTLSVYNSLIEPLVERTLSLTRDVLRDAGFTAEDIDRLILVGGSTRNHAINEAVSAAIKMPYRADRVDEVVSHGAAMVAADLLLPTASMKLSEAYGHSLGIDVLGDGQQMLFQAIIPRQTPYPCRRGFVGWTNRAMQTTAELNVYRGEDSNPEKNTQLGQLRLPVSPSIPRVAIGAIFELDRDGILHFTAVQLPSGSALDRIAAHARYHDGEMLLEDVDALIQSGQAKTKSIVIQI